MNQEYGTKILNLAAITRNIKAFAMDIFEKEAAIVAVVPLDAGWKATAEINMDDEYTQRYAMKDLIHIFEIAVSNQGEITSYERVAIRERGEYEGQRSGR